MRLLIFGGPKFLGRATIDAALAAGHSVTVFNRGQTNAGLYPQIEWLRGDRDGQLGALNGGAWDAVIDNSGYFPRIVRQSAELLSGAVGRYVFISSISAYRDLAAAGIAEDYPLAVLDDESVEEVTGETYGGLKALCEQAVRQTYGSRALVIRPGLIVGPHDPTHRFTYWVTRVAQGGEVLAPVGPEYRTQFIDVRDLAEWVVRMCETSAEGTFNATGPDYTLTLGAVLEAAKAVSGSDAEFTWLGEKFLLESGVSPWSDLPLWAPADLRIHEVSIERALKAGLTFRPLEETVRDTLDWSRPEADPEPLPAGLTPAREAELLARHASLP